MRYIALATDYDGTLAARGAVDEHTLDGLQRLRQSGRQLIMVTGRELPDLKSVFKELNLFDCVVAENGALLYHPQSREECPLTERPPQQFLDALAAKDVPFSVGQGIVATWEPHQNAV